MAGRRGRNALTSPVQYVENYDRLNMPSAVAQEMDPIVSTLERSQLRRGARENPNDGEQLDRVLEIAMENGWQPPPGGQMTPEDWESVFAIVNGNPSSGYGGDMDTDYENRIRNTMGMPNSGRGFTDPYAGGGQRTRQVDPRMLPTRRP